VEQTQGDVRRQAYTTRAYAQEPSAHTDTLVRHVLPIHTCIIWLVATSSIYLPLPNIRLYHGGPPVRLPCSSNTLCCLMIVKKAFSVEALSRQLLLVYDPIHLISDYAKISVTYS
jgi:hypothetical protein